MQTVKQNIWLREGDPNHWNVERQLSWESDGTGYHVARSMALVCPTCGSRWAILRMENEEDTWPVAAFCTKHPKIREWQPVPGSILVEVGYGVIDEPLLAKLPLELLKREFELHLKAYGESNDTTNRATVESQEDVGGQSREYDLPNTAAEGS